MYHNGTISYTNNNINDVFIVLTIENKKCMYQLNMKTIVTLLSIIYILTQTNAL